MLGLFDRPADEKALGALLKPPVIPGLTEQLTDLNPTEWQTILARLRRARLLAGKDPHRPGQLDTHPLIREHFGEQLRSERSEAWRECNRRLFHYYRTFAPELPNGFREMEPLFLSVICGCNAGLFREALHEVYIPRIQRGDAFFAGRVLGARGTLLLVLAHFFEHGRWGLLVQTGPEEESLAAEDQVFILMQAALYLTATRGYGAREAQICYERVESLCNSHRLVIPHSVLIGQWRYSLVTDKLSATMWIAKRIFSLAQERNDTALMMGAYRALGTTVYFLGDFELAREYLTRGLQIWRSGDVQCQVEEVTAHPVAYLYYSALVEWNFGELASCQAAIAEAIALAKDLNDIHGLAVSLYFAGVLAQLERNPVEVERVASNLIELSTRQNFALWLACGTLLRGWAQSVFGDIVEGISLIQVGIAGAHATGTMVFTPFLASA